MINLSYIKLKGKVIDNYTSTLKGWHNKMVNWEDMHKPMSDSSIQYSCYSCLGMDVKLELIVLEINKTWLY
jgi:hypothetical protein